MQYRIISIALIVPWGRAPGCVVGDSGVDASLALAPALFYLLRVVTSERHHGPDPVGARASRKDHGAIDWAIPARGPRFLHAGARREHIVHDQKGVATIALVWFQCG